MLRGRCGLLFGIILAYLSIFCLTPATGEFGSWGWQESENAGELEDDFEEPDVTLTSLWKILFPSLLADPDLSDGQEFDIESEFLSVERRALGDSWPEDPESDPEDEESETNFEVPQQSFIQAENTLVVNLQDTDGNLDDLVHVMSDVLDIPINNIHVDPLQSHGTEVGLYFVKPGFDVDSVDPAALLTAADVESQLAAAGLQHHDTDLHVEHIQPQQVRESGMDMAAYAPSSQESFWNIPYVPYVIAASAVIMLTVVMLTAWCCHRNRTNKSPPEQLPTQDSALLPSGLPQQQICLYPAAKPNVNNATTIQPDITQIITNKACGGCGTPIRLPGTPLSLSGSGTGSPAYSSSQSGTPIPGTPVHTPPLRLRSRLGLLERRGSNASLTIDLGTVSSDSSHMGSPPKESSAEEYLLSAGNRMSRKQLRHCLRNIKALYEEFWEIPMNHPDKIAVAGSGMKNRYRTIIPNENTRLKLPEIDSDPLSEYINANYIRGYAGEPRAYIATQGPMSNTVHDFWRMVWQEKAPIIVMITKLKEKNKTKCESYLPETHAVYGPIEVFLEDISEKEGYMIRHLRVKYLDEEHRVLHYWYTAWPDHKAPNMARQLLTLVKEVDKQRHDPLTNRVKGPVIVHCSAGIGRTGCFIGTSIGMKQLKEEHMVDVLGFVCSMRTDRGGMVQTNEQYEFVHQALMLYERELAEWSPSGD